MTTEREDRLRDTMTLELEPLVRAAVADLDKAGRPIDRSRRRRPGMSLVADMLRSTPARLAFEHDQLVECIEACVECAQTCTACADADLGEESVLHLRRCIATCLSCADVCETTARVLARPWGQDEAMSRAVLEACQVACRLCAEECERHARMHEHCRLCGEACRRCERACAALIG